jgi:transketolase
MRGKFKDIVTQMAEDDPRIVIVLGDISVFQFNAFREKHPDRFYNMGILEPTLISVSGGLNAAGFVPVVHTIAPFLTERCYEQIKLDLCYNRFEANLVTCGASFDYAWDGATHHAYSDLAILRLLPTMEVIQPGSERELDVLIRSQMGNGNPTYFRLSDHPHNIDTGDVKFGSGTVMKRGTSGFTIMTAGPILANVLDACKDLNVSVVYFHTIKPLDEELVASFRDDRILVVHDAFGLKEAVDAVGGMRTWYHGLPDAFCVWYGKVHDIRRRLGLDPAGIRARVQEMMAQNA